MQEYFLGLLPKPVADLAKLAVNCLHLVELVDDSGELVQPQVEPAELAEEVLLHSQYGSWVVRMVPMVHQQHGNMHAKH